MPRDRAEDDREQPALLYPFTANWRWTSWREWDREVRDLTLRLGDVPVGTRVGFRWRPRPSALTRDRAIRAAGLVSVPVEDSLKAPVDGWAGEGAPSAELEIRPGEPRETLPSHPSGSVVVQTSRGPVVWDARDCSRAAESIRSALGSLRADRALAFVSGCPFDPVERGYLEWALEERAALLLAGDRAIAGPGFLWSRPTVACLDDERLGFVEAALRSAGSVRRLRRRFRRLEALLLSGSAPGTADRELWRALDVRLVKAPMSLP